MPFWGGLALNNNDSSIRAGMPGLALNNNDSSIRAVMPGASLTNYDSSRVIDRSHVSTKVDSKKGAKNKEDNITVPKFMRTLFWSPNLRGQ